MSKSEWLDYQKPKPKNLEPPKSTSNQPQRGTDTGWAGNRHDEEMFVALDRPYTQEYHRMDCEKVHGLTSTSTIKLSKEQAEAKGLKPCPICKP